jgi:hypothetical protein
MAGVENRAGKVSLGLLLRHEQGYSLEIKGYGKQPKRKLLTHRKCQMAGKSPQREKDQEEVLHPSNHSSDTWKAVRETGPEPGIPPATPLSLASLTEHPLAL